MYICMYACMYLYGYLCVTLVMKVYFIDNPSRFSYLRNKEYLLFYELADVVKLCTYIVRRNCRCFGIFRNLKNFPFFAAVCTNYCKVICAIVNNLHCH